MYLVHHLPLTLGSMDEDVPEHKTGHVSSGTKSYTENRYLAENHLVYTCFGLARVILRVLEIE